jgi:hypothetical protein
MKSKQKTEGARFVIDNHKYLITSKNIVFCNHCDSKLNDKLASCCGSYY